jgi:hypothetical protein
MKLSEAKDRYVFRTTLKLDEFGKDFITLREPTMEEMTGFTAAAGDEGRMDAVEKLFPACIVDHTFTGEDGKKASAEEVHAFLKESSTLCTDVVDRWFSALPFRNKPKRGVGNKTDG